MMYKGWFLFPSPDLECVQIAATGSSLKDKVYCTPHFFPPFRKLFMRNWRRGSQIKKKFLHATSSHVLICPVEV